MVMPTLAVAAAAFWLPPLRSSFWLDETGTFWTIKDGLGPAFHRSLEIQGQSPFFYVVEWAFRAVFGSSELAMRLPSLLALAGAAYVVGRIARRLFHDSTIAWVAALAFAATSSVAFAAADARPYGPALLFGAAATLALVRWLEDGKTSDIVWYVVAVTLTVYAHYLTAVVLGAHVLYLLARRKSALPKMLGAFAAVAVLCLPLLPQFLALWDRRGSLSAAIALHPSRLAVIVAAPLALAAFAIVLHALRDRASGALETVAAAALAGVAVLAVTSVSIAESLSLGLVVTGIAVAALAVAFAWRTLRRRATLPDADKSAAVLLVAWAILPPLVMYALTSLDIVNVFVPRYYVSAAPGLALLVAWAVRQLRSEWLRLVVGVALLAGAVAAFEPDHFVEDWRGAVAAANAYPASEPRLVRTDFIEARSVESLTDPVRSSFILAPIAMYPLRGPVYPLPYGVTTPEATYVAGLLRAIGDAPFLIVTNRIHTYETLLARQGYRTRAVGVFGSIRVVEFSRTA